MTDNEKPKLGMRAPLGLKRTVETGKVKQSFSHGRSNTVVVEVKKRAHPRPPGRAPPRRGRRSRSPAPAPRRSRAGARRRARARRARPIDRDARRSSRPSCCARPRKRA